MQTSQIEFGKDYAVKRHGVSHVFRVHSIITTKMAKHSYSKVAGKLYKVEDAPAMGRSGDLGGNLGEDATFEAKDIDGLWTDYRDLYEQRKTHEAERRAEREKLDAARVNAARIANEVLGPNSAKVNYDGISIADNALDRLLPLFLNYVPDEVQS